MPAVAEKREPLRKDAKVIAKELQRMVDDGTELTPRNIVNAARFKKSILHSYFEWDDAKAGEKYREIEAYKMIAAWHTFRVVTGRKKDVINDGEKAFKLRSALPRRDGSFEFRPREEALSDPENRARIISAFIAELKNWINRTSDITELISVRDLISKALEKSVW